MDDDLDDTHLCIKCNETIVGLNNYIQHRKQNCSKPATSSSAQTTKLCTTTSTSVANTSTDVTPAITYVPFSFNEPEPANPTSHGGKTSKVLTDTYELPYELEADVFFSSLQLQSVQSTVGQHLPPTSGGKTGTSQHIAPLSRQKSVPQESEANAAASVSWMNGDTPNQSGSEQYQKDNIFKTITYEHESPEVTEEEEEEEYEVAGDVEDDDEDYEPINEAHASGGKWKLSLMRHSPPVVPISHTGGKWKPEHRPNIRVAHSQLSRASPTWDDHLEYVDAHEGQHPPADHTKGKWLPGTKLQRLEFKEVVELAKCSKTNQDYWCNICCRKLKSKMIYEHHLKTPYHLKRAEPELQLEKAAINELPKEDIKKSFAVVEFNPRSITVSTNNKKRNRRCTYLRCSLCKHALLRHLIGKHLISHYHYRRMQLYPGASLPMILENIHAIVLQSPFQCRPCRFYANTEETFLLHWNSASHLDASEGPGRFWCSYCQFECEDSNQMRRHLLGSEHQEVLWAINRSVPIYISKRLSIDCPKCGQSFRFNFELRRHFVNFHPSVEFMGTASDVYQSKFKCLSCPEVLPSKIALQRHEKFKHFISKYFCSICNLEFSSPCQARRHRKVLEHKQKALAANHIICPKTEPKELLDVKIEKSSPEREEPIEDDEPSISKQANQNLLQEPPLTFSISYKCKDCPFTTASEEVLTLHEQKEHTRFQHFCIVCSSKFESSQELGRHSRTCKPDVIAKPEDIKLPDQLQEIVTESGESVWKCELCDFKAPFRSDILFHRVFHSYSNVGKNQQLPCPLCDKTFRKQSLRYHLHTHTKEPIFKCKICSSSFSRQHGLKEHLKNIHGKGSKTVGEAEVEIAADTNASDKTDGSVKCKSCDKVFKSKYTMNRHHVTHHASQPAENRQLFKCTFANCKYVSDKKTLLKIHLNSHSIKNFKCTKTGCSYMGKSKLHLKRHLNFHTPTREVKRFACDQCPFRTKTRTHLLRHTRRHTGEKPYACPHCDLRSTTWENLRKHILKTDKHAGKFVFECEKCKEELDSNTKQNDKKKTKKTIYMTNSLQEYKHHMKTVHKESKKISLMKNC